MKFKLFIILINILYIYIINIISIQSNNIENQLLNNNNRKLLSTTKYLYEDTIINELNLTTYKKEISLNNNPSLIVFYAPWCPHCQHYKDEWVSIGEYFKDTDIINIDAVNCVAESNICRGESIRGYPTIKAWNFIGIENGLVIKDRKKLALVKFVELNIPKIDQIKLNENNNNKDKEFINNKKIEEPFRANRISERLQVNSKERLKDATSAILYYLDHHVFMINDELSENRRNSLLIWLKLLSETFPGIVHRQSIHKLINKLTLMNTNNPNGINLIKNEPITNIYEWKEYLKSWTFSPFLKSNDWATCKKDMNYLRINNNNENNKNKNENNENVWIHDEAHDSFTCGLWTLFHILTVGSGQIHQTALPYETMNGIYIFIKEFFACLDCAEHFIQMYDGCFFQRCDIMSLENIKFNNENEKYQRIQDDSKKLALWLWQLHNIVNIRLGIEHGLDNSKLKLTLWPQENICLDCWILDENNQININDMLKSIEKNKIIKNNEIILSYFNLPKFNEENVYKFLLKEYWSDEWSTRGSIGYSSYSIDTSTDFFLTPYQISYAIIFILIIIFFIRFSSKSKVEHKKY